MIIYSEYYSSRLIYTLNYIFWDRLGLSYQLTDDVSFFNQSDDKKLNYSNLIFDDIVTIIPEGLLAENYIREQKTQIQYKDNLPLLFANQTEVLGFDFFAAVFWYISRYEEYQPYRADSHNRFPATESLAHQYGLLYRPLVDEWLNTFREFLKKHFPDIEPKTDTFNWLTTIDVDSPWCYKNKGFCRNVGGTFRDFVKGNFKLVGYRLLVLSGLLPDPWFKFDWLLNHFTGNEHHFIFFIHVGNHGKFDKSARYNSKAFKNFINTLKDKVLLGLHASYNASEHDEIFKEERNRLAGLTERKIGKNRQHYLVFETRNYFQRLIALRIKEDYSMGFADKPGFRAGTGRPFYFFDLLQNRETNLMIHPFVVMDRTLNQYEGKSAEDAELLLMELVENVRKINGTFVSLWHNESLSDRFEWKGWQAVFKNLNDYLLARV